MDDVVTSIYSALDAQKAQPCTIQAIQSHAITEDIVDLNDKAVASILKNDHQTALQTLQMALARILALQSQPQHCLPFGEDSPIASIPLSTPASSSNDGVFVVFNRALVISHSDDFDLSCPKNRSRALATILYNVGLVYHLEAVHRGDSAILGHALTYYGWSYYVVESASQQYGFHDVLLLLLSLFNNM